MNKKEFNVSLSVKNQANKIIRGIFRNETGVCLNIQLVDGDRAFDYRGFSQVVVEALLPDGNTVYADGLKDSDAINPEDGMLCFNLPITHTSTIGMHYLTIHIYGGGHVMATARLNYYVDDTPEDLAQYLSEVDAAQNSRFTALQQALAMTDNFAMEEENRVIAEQNRRAAELEREDATNGIISQVIEYYDEMANLLEQAKEYKHMIQQLIEQIGEIGQITLDDVVLQSQIATISGGTFTTVDKVIKLRSGLAADIPTLAAGEIGYATDTGKLYIGSASGNVLLNPDQESAFVYSAVAPTDTSKMWIDSSSNALKVYDSVSQTWKAVVFGTAVFA